MTSIPSSLARVPNLMSSQVMLGNLTRTSNQLLRTQIELATGRTINKPSDNAVGAGLVGVLDDIIERRDQRLRNLSHAEAVLGTVDQALADATTLMQEAREVGLSQIGVGSDATTRANQARVIDAMLNEMISIANRTFQDVHLFGGSRTATAPFERLLTGLAYRGSGSGMVTDLGNPTPFGITLSGGEAFGSLSSRVEGARDLDPRMDDSTRLVHLQGARGLGVSPGTIRLDVNGNDYELDLTGAETIGDVARLIEDFLNANEPGALDAGGVTIDSATGNRLNIDLNAGFTLTFGDAGAGTMAQDLGLTSAAFEDGVNETGDDLNPVLTDLTPLSLLTGVTVPLGTIRLTNMGQSRDLDLSGAQTIQDIRNAVAALNIGIRVEIAPSGDRLNFINELSGGLMSIAEVGGGTTATELGARSLDSGTRLSDFNQGRGVQIRSGSVDPVTGLPDPQRDLDFRVTLKDGRTFDVDLAGSQTVQDVLDAINAAAANAGIVVPGEFEAGLVGDGNGLALTDNTVGAGATSVTALNGSFAAHDLGILGSTTGAVLAGSDRATVAVESVFAHLIALRDALDANDERGIEFATGKLSGDIDRLARTRADVGVRAQRVVRMSEREQDMKIQDAALKSSVQDTDFAEAASRFANLQTQLQAGLTGTSRALSISLLDFLR
ncbi:MAG: hypothetical protein HRU76_09490 [Phycisphaeraceae bacterium]|nr:hypothetical protein [Phycisphaerales bacterium]QOJ17802.1 MAG: hypothetical protein HRU76_09490 [Phycisphaeraceae bacterium]